MTAYLLLAALFVRAAPQEELRLDAFSPNLTGRALIGEEVFVPVRVENTSRQPVVLLGTPLGSRLQFSDRSGRWLDCTGPRTSAGLPPPSEHVIEGGSGYYLEADVSECASDLREAGQPASEPRAIELRFVARTNGGKELASSPVRVEVRKPTGIDADAAEYLRRVDRGQVVWSRKEFFEKYGVSVEAGRLLAGSRREIADIDARARTRAAAMAADPEFRRGAKEREVLIKKWLAHNGTQSLLAHRLLLELASYQAASGETEAARETARRLSSEPATGFEQAAQRYLGTPSSK